MFSRPFTCTGNKFSSCVIFAVKPLRSNASTTFSVQVFWDTMESNFAVEIDDVSRAYNGYVAFGINERFVVFYLGSSFKPLFR
jgi:hypothetical protein